MAHGQLIQIRGPFFLTKEETESNGHYINFLDYFEENTILTKIGINSETRHKFKLVFKENDIINIRIGSTGMYELILNYKNNDKRDEDTTINGANGGPLVGIYLCDDESESFSIDLYGV